MKPTRNPFAAASCGGSHATAADSRRRGTKDRRSTLRRSRLLTLSALALLGAPGAMGANIYWDGSGTGWNSLASWSTAAGAISPDPVTVPGIADLFLFNISTVNTPQTVNLNAAQSALGLSFASAGTVLLQGGGTDRTLTLASSGITKSGTGAITIGSVTTGQQVSLVLSSTQTWANNNNTGALTILNGVAPTTTTSLTLTLSGTSTAANTISGIMANNGSRVLTVNKSGTGTWLLSGGNTFTGRTTISGGILQLGSATALGSTAGRTTISGGSLDLNGQTVGAEPISFSGTSSLVNNSGTAARLSGTIGSLRPTSSIGGTGDLTLSGVISSSSNTSTTAWTKIGTGKLTLSGANTYARALTISAGVVNIQHATALGTTAGRTTVNANAALEIQGNITVGAEALTLNGTGISAGGALRNISGTNIYGGLITLGSATRINSDADTLRLSNIGTITGAGFGLTVGGAGNTTISSIIGTTSGTLTKDGTGMLTLGGANTYTGVTTLTGGILSVGTIGNGGTAGNLGAASNAAGNLVFNGGTLRFTGISATSNRNFTINAGKVATFEVTANTLTLSGASPATTGGLTKSGAGTLILTGSQLYTGPTTLSAGKLALSGAGAISDSSAVTVAAGIFDIAASTASGETIGSLAGASGSSVVLGGKTLTTGGDATSTSFAGVLSGSGSLIKLGAGTMTLSGSNTHTGGTTITAGALSVAASSALGPESNLLTIGSGATLKVSESFGTSRATTLGGAGSGVGGTFEVAAGKTLDYSSGSSISGTGSLIKTGTGTLLLEGTNPFTGGLYIQAGTLAANSQTALGAVPTSGSPLYALHLYDGATFQTQVSSWSTYRQLELVGDHVGTGGVAKVDVTGSNTHQRDGVISGAGKLDLIGTGTLTLTAANTYSGATTVTSGTLKLGHATALGDIAAGTTVASGAALDILGQTVGAEALTLSGTGISSGGALINSDGTAASLSGNITLAAASSVGGSGPMTLSGVISGSSMALTKVGAGILTLTGDDTNTGNTEIVAGELRVNNPPVLDEGVNVSTATGSGTVTLASGATLSGTGRIAGSVTVATGTGAITAGNGVSGSLAISGDLAFTGAGIINIGTLSNYTGSSSAALAVTGALTLSGGAGAITLALPNGAASNGTYHLVSHSNALTDLTGLTVTGPDIGSRQVATLANNSGVIDYVVSGGYPVWKGTVGNNSWNAVTGNEIWQLVTLNGGTLSSDSSDARSLANNLVIGGNVTLGNATNTGTLTFSGAVDLDGLTKVLTIDSAVTLSGVISGTNGGLSKAGTGTLTLSNTNTYTGDTTLSAGTLGINSSGSLGASGSMLVFTGNSTLQINATFTAARNYLINSGVTGTIDTQGYTFTNSGIISGAGSLTKTGSGIMIMTGLNSYTGATTISAGTLQLGDGITNGSISGSSGITNNSALIFNLPDSSSYGNIISGTGTLTKTGAGTLTLSNTNTYTGATAITGGTLSIAADSGLGTAPGSITAGQLVLNGSTLAATDTFTLDSNRGVQLTTTSTLDVVSTKTLSHSGVVAGPGGLIKSGDGTLELLGRNKFEDDITHNAGTIVINSGLSLGSYAEGESSGQLLFAGNATLELAADVNSARSYVFNPGMTATIDTDGHTLEQSGVFSGSGALTKTGSGTLTLTGTNTNTYSGLTTVNTGELNLNRSPGTLVVSGNLTIGDGTGGANADIVKLQASGQILSAAAVLINGTSGKLDLNGHAQVIGSLADTGTVTTNGSSVTLGTAGALTVGDATASTTFSGVISGTNGTLVKQGSGILVLAGDNTYTGATTVAVGTLVIDGDQQSATGAVSVSGKLAGTGTVGGDTTITSGGTHAPGGVGTVDAVGTQDFASNLNYAPGSIFEWDLNENQIGTAFDMVGGAGAVTVDTSNTTFKIVFGDKVDMNNDFWSAPWVTRTWAMTSIFGSAFSGAFAKVDTGTYAVNPLGTFTISGDYLTYSTVPEPTNAVVGLLLGAALLRRQRGKETGRGPKNPT